MATEANRTESATSRSASARKISIDVFRGMVMFLMLAEVLHLYSLAEKYPDNAFFEWLKFHTTHVKWEGCSLHDMIQPAFTFLVGVSMPFSIASRLRRGQSTARLLLHAAWRAVALSLLGIVLRSLDSDRTYFTFEDTLTQIGMGYFFVFLIALAPRWVHYAAAIGIPVLFWAAFALTPAPEPDFDYGAVGVSDNWPHHYEGFASRWNKNSNLSWRTDVWFMNLFPRESEFKFNGGGYSTLSFVPTAATMVFGLLAGVWLRELTPSFELWKRLLLAGVVGIAVGWVLNTTGLCPLVKRIWTPSFALFSGGVCMLWLLMLHWICDVRQWSRWAFPFIVIGANSILIYVMSWTVQDPIQNLLHRHFGDAPFKVFGEQYHSQLLGAATLAIMFAVLLWFYRRRAFVKI